MRHALAYKISQRTITFGTQPFFYDLLHQNHHEAFVAAVGKKRARNLEFASAAALVGTLEVVALPADTMKVRGPVSPVRGVGRLASLTGSVAHNQSPTTRTPQILHQTNPASVQGRSFFDIARQEGLRKLYRGALWTATRNAPGSFALFGGNALVKEQVRKHGVAVNRTRVVCHPCTRSS